METRKIADQFYRIGLISSSANSVVLIRKKNVPWHVSQPIKDKIECDLWNCCLSVVSDT